jgi:putative ABC transport system permease protein
MKAITLVLKNFSRRKTRSILNTFGLILAIAVIVSTFTISSAMSEKIGDEVEKYGPNIVVKPDSKSLTIPYGSIMVGQSTFPEKYAESIMTIKNSANIRVMSPKLYGQATIGNQTYLIVGINASKEIQLKSWWQILGEYPADDSNQVMIGSSLKKALNTDVNQTLSVNDQPLRVVSILSETGSNDDYTIYVPIRTAQTMLNSLGQITLIDIGAICNNCPVEEIARQINEVIPAAKATPVKQAVETRMKAVEQATNFSLMLASVVLVAGCAGVMNTMLGSVQERKKEIGVFMSLGADNSYLYRMFLYESVIMGAVGGLIGAGGGIAVSLLIGPIFAGVSPSLQSMPLYIVPLSLLLSVGACIVSSTYPAWRAMQIDPVKALKTV